MHFPIALNCLSPSVRYPPGWFHDGITPSSIQLSPTPIHETWSAMESLGSSHLVRSIGLSNFTCPLILDLLSYCTIIPATFQIEHHPYLVQAPLLGFAASKGITVTAYSSFGPQGYVEMDLDHALKTSHLFENDVIKTIAKSRGKTAPQLLLRWATQRGITVIPKSGSEEMLRENLDAKGFDLSEEEIERNSGLDRRLRFNDPFVYFGSLPIFD